MKPILILSAALLLAGCQTSTDDDAASASSASASGKTAGAAPANETMTTNMAGTAASGGGGVTVTINGARENGGPVLVALQTEGQFAQAAGTYSHQAQATGGAVTVRFAGVAPGRYAVAAVQDANNDGSFTIGATGPTEPYGFSGARQPGPPAFAPAAFDVTAAGASASVTLAAR